MGVEIGFREEGAPALFAVPVMGSVVFVEVTFIVEQLITGRVSTRKVGRIDAHLLAVRAVVMVIRAIIVVPQNCSRVEE